MTKFAPSERTSFDKIQENFDNFYNNKVIEKLLSAVPNMMLVLNQQRQVVYCNRALIETLGLDDKHVVLGLRPGEIFNCINASISEEGCGTTEFCRACGAVRAILETQRSGNPSRYECNMLIKSDEGIKALNLEVFTDELELEDDKFTTFHITNISSRKQAEMLEHLLFHNVIESTDSIVSALDLIVSNSDKERSEKYLRALQDSATRVADEIRFKQELLFLESGKVSVKRSELHSLIFLLDNVKKFMNLPLAEKIDIVIDPTSVSVGFISDKILLEKAIGLLITNALEHSKHGEEIKIGCINENLKIKFWIKNEEVMPEDIKLRVFQKSYSSMLKGKGYGTYTAKIIIENYLDGSLSFESNEIDKTIFIIELPNNIN